MRKERIFWGVLLILVGASLIINKLGYFPEVNTFKLMITAFLVVIIVKSIVHLSFEGILFPLAFICILFDDQLGITSITPWTVLIAAFLGSAGLSMIFKSSNKWDNKHHHNNHHKFEKVDVEEGDYIRFENSFGSSIKYVNTDNFEQGEIKCSFGGLTVYFDNARMKNEEAILRLDVSFAGVELYIPRSWRIENKVNISLGGITEKNKGDQITTNTLTIVGDVKFAGVEIIYV